MNFLRFGEKKKLIMFMRYPTTFRGKKKVPCFVFVRVFIYIFLGGYFNEYVHSKDDPFPGNVLVFQH